MKKIVIVGAGNFGANAALFLAENRLGHVVLIDSREGLAQGKALDLMETAPIRGYDAILSGANDLEALKGADVVVMAAGVSPRSDSNPDEIYQENYKVLEQVAKTMKTHAPDAVLVIQREPVAPLVRRAVAKLGLARKRVIGMAGLIESARYRYYMARAAEAAPRDASAMVIGGAGDSLIPLTQYANISGVPIVELLDGARIGRVAEETRQSALDILRDLKIASAYYSPAAALAELIAALARDGRRLLPVTVVPDGEYSLTDVAVTLPALIGPGGVEKIVEVRLTKEQKERLAGVAERVRAAVA